jgi:hypothetical protein
MIGATKLALASAMLLSGSVAIAGQSYLVIANGNLPKGITQKIENACGNVTRVDSFGSGSGQASLSCKTWPMSADGRWTDFADSMTRSGQSLFRVQPTRGAVSASKPQSQPFPL